LLSVVKKTIQTIGTTIEIEKLPAGDLDRLLMQFMLNAKRKMEAITSQTL